MTESWGKWQYERRKRFSDAARRLRRCCGESFQRWESLEKNYVYVKGNGIRTLLRTPKQQDVQTVRNEPPELHILFRLMATLQYNSAASTILQECYTFLRRWCTCISNNNAGFSTLLALLQRQLGLFAAKRKNQPILLICSLLLLRYGKTSPSSTPDRLLIWLLICKNQKLLILITQSTCFDGLFSR